ncbi:NADH dehydrogenase [Pullulanibacillus pueri]|uniref:NADH dehydrogenase-like protein YutJ n=1 Tax=Pullulanibacillus pueri TaxID=1437324 RepID=A0A8J2ZW98_9BACL|nr:FAD-dependent oxidoreductase [Pullulanibacillus pueri]MBM7682265.1 NADH dehydrogenase [Pullulanibacillus pueri]GGH81026.1 NADH dehydrogenase-like protein YutJ [Pullulanibacillus pueri]
MIHIVILGGGYGGLEIVKLLTTKELKQPFYITLVDRHPFHSIKTEYHALAAGTLSDDRLRMDFPEHECLRKVCSEVSRIDLKSQIVFTVDQEIPFHYLIIALGSEDRFHTIKGAAPVAKSIQTIENTRKTYESIQNTKPYGTVKIIGGGLSGVELASELRESRKDLNIHIVERGHRILKTFSDRIQLHVHEWLNKHDVQVINHSNIEYIRHKAIYNNGERQEADVIIWAAGVHPTSVVRQLEAEKDPLGRLIIDQNHRLIRYPQVFAVGDCSSTAFAPSAQIAKQQGCQVGDYLIDVLNYKAPQSKKKLVHKGTLGSLGKKDGFGVIGKVVLTGRTPRRIKRWVEYAHLKGY